jgi:uncharacterized protein YbjT (DUF2867 family)
MIVVFGANGRIGGAAARAFLEHGAAVRAFVRSAERAQELRRRGAEIVIGSLEKPDDVRRAVDGANAVFHVCPFGLQHPDPLSFELEMGRRIIDAAKAAGVQHHLYVSAFGCDRPGGGVRQLENKATIEGWIKAAGLPYTFLRANYLMDHFKRQLDEIRTGRLAGAMKPEVALSLVAIRDVAKAAWTAFRDKKTGAAYDLVGPRPVTFVEAAEAFGLALGRRVTYDCRPAAEWSQAVWGGQSPALAQDCARLFDLYNRGGFVASPLPLLRELGLRPISIIDFALAAVR